MITISPEAWCAMVEHAELAYPKECCGILLGTDREGRRQAVMAIACRNVYDGEQSDRFQLDPKEQIAADRKAREMGVDVLGFYHSHPDCDAYFSATDLKYSWPWYSNVVLSVKAGKLSHAKAFIANADQTATDPEELVIP